MITKEIAVALPYGTTLFHIFRTDSTGRSMRCRVMGRCKTWKTRPDEWELPVKHGLRDHFRIGPWNAQEWRTEESPS